MAFQKNTRVNHKVFGKGTVSLVERENITVIFDEYGKKTIRVAFLEEIFDIEETSQSTIGFSIPESMTNLDYFVREEKEVFSKLKTKFPDAIIAYGTSPLVNLTNNRLGFVLSKTKGLVVYRLNLTSDVQLFTKADQIPSILKEMGDINVLIMSRLLESKPLIANVEGNKTLLFPIKTVMIFPNLEYNSIQGKDMGIFRALQNRFLFRNLRYESEILSSNFFQFESHSMGDQEISISDMMFTQILARILPEYSTWQLLELKTKIPSISKPAEVKEMPPITGKERDYRIFALDEDQVKIVNGLSKGHHLFIACAGTGKSVLLLSQAYRLCNSIHRGRVLITCFNKQLANRYSYLSEMSGFTQHNLSIKTTYSLMYELVRVHTPSILDITDSDSFDRLFKECQRLMDAGLIQPMYEGIFIDEIQLIEPEHINFLYMLLKTPRSDEYFYMYGDLNQDVRNSQRRGMATWQRADKLPALTGRVKYLSKNYRNTKEIACYLDAQIGIIKDVFVSRLKIQIPNEFFAEGNEAISNGLVPKIYRTKEKSKTLAQKTLQLIKNIVDNGSVQYSDVCVIFPFENHKALGYTAVSDLKDALDQSGIEYSSLSGEKKVTLQDARGVVFSTIQSALGLDFEVVILYAIKPLGYYFCNNSDHVQPILINAFEKVVDHKHGLIVTKDEIAQFFSENARQIYTACSRARKQLYIIHDMDDKSVLNDIITPREERNSYEYIQIE